MAKKKRKRKLNNRSNGNRKNSSRKVKSQFKAKRIKPRKDKTPIITVRIKRWIGAVFMIVIAIVVSFSFFDKAGTGGASFLNVLKFIVFPI